MKQLLKEWDRIWLQNGVLGRVRSGADSEQDIFQVIVPRQEASDVWRQYHNGMGHPSSGRTLAALFLAENGERRETMDRDLSTVCARQGET